MPEPEPERELVLTNTVMSEYGVSRSTLERAIRAGELTAYRRVGVRGRLFDRAQLDEFFTPKAVS